jgi:hypothetical protein
MAVGVANLEPAQTIVGILEGRAESFTMIGKFDGESIRVRCIDVGIPPHGGQRFGFGSGDVSLSDLMKIYAPSRPMMAKKGFGPAAGILSQRQACRGKKRWSDRRC